MDAVRQLLEALARGEASVDEVAAAIARPGAGGVVDDFAVVDHDRASRCGFPEVVYCAGKEPPQAVAISEEILSRSPRVLLTRATEAHAAALLARWPAADHHARARCVVIDPEPLPRRGRVVVVAAGTSDLPVADEARVTAATMGADVELITDVGVAGLHRLLARVDRLRRAHAIVAVAGMEGALPSVVAGLVDRPVFAVPTSVGYGAHLGGLTALLAMLNSCAAGLAVVNVDNGFGAGFLAAQINRLVCDVDSRVGDA
ncbi:MAG: nickel pincer cofactor biosynthesis protein LarB [Planctomycetota bacterium]